MELPSGISDTARSHFLNLWLSFGACKHYVFHFDPHKLQCTDDLKQKVMFGEETITIRILKIQIIKQAK